MGSTAKISVNMSLSEYIRYPVTRDVIDALRNNQASWDKAAERLNITISFLMSIGMMVLFFWLLPEKAFSNFNLKSATAVTVGSAFIAIIWYLSMFPFAKWLTFRRYAYELNIGDLSFHTPDQHKSDDFDVFHVDPEKISHNPRAMELLTNIQAMQRFPVGFEYRLIKSMITL